MGDGKTLVIDLRKEVFRNNVGGIFFDCAIVKFNIVHKRVEDKLVVVGSDVVAVRANRATNDFGGPHGLPMWKH